MMKNRCYLMVMVLALISCSKPEPIPFEIPPNAKELLSGGYKQTWKLAQRFNNDTRMNMEGCFMSYRLTIADNMTLTDNNGNNSDCGETLKANWKFVKDKEGSYYIRLQSPQIPRLMNIEEDFKLMKILQLEKEKLVVQFFHKQFSNKTTEITDYYVPEHVAVKGRDFHW